jgi:hypothetical protein
MLLGFNSTTLDEGELKMGEMQCYCENKKDHHQDYCNATISFIHHHDWSSPEDYVCEECLEKCYPQ